MMAATSGKFALSLELFLAAIFIMLSVTPFSAHARQCYWCGPLAEQVHRSRRAPPCNSAGRPVITVCEPGYTHCAVVATAPPYTESRYCVKLYQDECYPLFCNTTKTWKMTCPCRGDLCNGANGERELDAFEILSKLVAKTQTRIKKRSPISDLKHKSKKIVNPDDEPNELTNNSQESQSQILKNLTVDTVTVGNDTTSEDVDFSSPSVTTGPFAPATESLTTMIEINIKQTNHINSDETSEKVFLEIDIQADQNPEKVEKQHKVEQNLNTKDATIYQSDTSDFIDESKVTRNPQRDQTFEDTKSSTETMESNQPSILSENSATHTFVNTERSDPTSTNAATITTPFLMLTSPTDLISTNNKDILVTTMSISVNEQSVNTNTNLPPNNNTKLAVTPTAGASTEKPAEPESHETTQKPSNQIRTSTEITSTTLMTSPTLPTSNLRNSTLKTHNKVPQTKIKNGAVDITINAMTILHGIILIKCL